MEVSVIVAAYNIEKYIKKCLLSILEQSMKDIEIIVVNDGSTDNTLNVIEEIIQKEKRIKLINQKNCGLIEARKTGLKYATGEYILFVDGDDWLEEDCLEKLYKEAKKDSYDIVMYNAFWVNKDKKKLMSTFDNKINSTDDLLSCLFLGKIMPTMWAKLIKRSFICENNIQFPKDISYAEDLATVASLFMNKPKVSFIEDSLYNYYQREDSITKKNDNRILEVDEAITFIENQLKSSFLYDKYKKEFEYMVYIHLFFYRFISSDRYEEIHREVLKKFKDRNISINKNSYIKDSISLLPVSYRIRIKLYNYNYYFGRIYDFNRKIAKRIIPIKNKLK